MPPHIQVLTIVKAGSGQMNRKPQQREITDETATVAPRQQQAEEVRVER